MDYQILKIGKCLCEEFGEGCNKCSMNSSPEATECCSVYDEAEQLAKERFVKDVARFKIKLEEKYGLRCK